MRLNGLKPPSGALRTSKRVGRGPGSGHGKTACRGSNGQRSRSGSKSRAWFEGGQTPIYRRLPKRGFNNPFKIRPQVVNLRDISAKGLEGTITTETLKEAGLIRTVLRPVKVLGDGSLRRPLHIVVAAFSRSAIERIEQAGGKAEVA